MCGDGCVGPRRVKRLHELYVVLDNFSNHVFATLIVERGLTPRDVSTEIVASGSGRLRGEQ